MALLVFHDQWQKMQDKNRQDRLINLEPKDPFNVFWVL